MYIRIPGDKTNDADYAEQAVSFPTLDEALAGLEDTLGSYDVATILDATGTGVSVAAKAEGFSEAEDALAHKAYLDRTAPGVVATLFTSGHAARAVVIYRVV